MPASAPAPRLIHESKAGLKNYAISAVIGLISLGLLIGAFVFYEQKRELGGTLGQAAASALLFLWFIYEARGLTHVRRVFPTHIDELRFGKPYQTISLSEPFAFSFMVTASGDSAILSVRAEGKKSISFTNTGTTSLRDVEVIRNHLTQAAVNLIRKTLTAGKPFSIDPKLVLTSAAAQVEGRSIPWTSLRLQEDDDSGELRIFQGQTQVATRSLMDDNMIPFLTFARNRRG